MKLKNTEGSINLPSEFGYIIHNMSSTRESVLAQMDEKDRIEQTIKELWEILHTNNIGMNEPLVDDEGFPRGEIDVYQVRHARHQIKCLQNDHTSLMKRIEDGLNEIHSAMKTSDADPNGVNMAPPSPVFEPFAKVDKVDMASPAHIGGIKVDDLVLKFGSVTLDNFRGLSSIGQVVQHSVNQPIQVKVLRDARAVNLSITPRQWTGRGLLGCNVVPCDRPDR